MEGALCNCVLFELGSLVFCQSFISYLCFKDCCCDNNSQVRSFHFGTFFFVHYTFKLIGSEVKMLSLYMWMTCVSGGGSMERSGCVRGRGGGGGGSRTKI